MWSHYFLSVIKALSMQNQERLFDLFYLSALLVFVHILRYWLLPHASTGGIRHTAYGIFSIIIILPVFHTTYSSSTVLSTYSVVSVTSVLNNDLLVVLRSRQLITIKVARKIIIILRVIIKETSALLMVKNL